MAAEFRALGIDRREAPRITDATLEFLHRCFAADEVESHGQRCLFRPRPARPPIIVGGAPPHALRRAARFGDGWMPMGNDPAALRPLIARFRDEMAAAGKPAPHVVMATSLPVDDGAAAAARAREFAAAGATEIVHGARYQDGDAFLRTVEVLARHVVPALRG